jgi:hypothetical protein
VSDTSSGHRPQASARAIAARVVQRALADGAFVSDALDEELRQLDARLDVRDRALATELSYGVIRIEPVLGERLERLAERPQQGR